MHHTASRSSPRARAKSTAVHLAGKPEKSELLFFQTNKENKVSFFWRGEHRAVTEQARLTRRFPIQRSPWPLSRSPSHSHPGQAGPGGQLPVAPSSSSLMEFKNQTPLLLAPPASALQLTASALRCPSLAHSSPHPLPLQLPPYINSRHPPPRRHATPSLPPLPPSLQIGSAVIGTHPAVAAAGPWPAS
jgi:hypothetical protein